MIVVRTCLLCLLYACGPVSTPSAPSTGGASAVSTTPVDWYERCILVEIEKPDNLNVARQTGSTITTLVGEICSQRSVIACYEKGVCK